MDLNLTMLCGRLTRDPDLKFTAGGTAVCNLGLAVNRKYKKGDTWESDVCFVDVVVWGKMGEATGNHMKKGSEVLITGRLQFRRWETKEGQKRSKLEVVAERVQFGARPKGQEGGTQESGTQESGSGNDPGTTEPPASGSTDEDEVPF